MNFKLKIFNIFDGFLITRVYLIFECILLHSVIIVIIIIVISILLTTRGIFFFLDMIHNYFTKKFI